MVEVPSEYQRKIPFNYPAHQRGDLIEEYFLKYFRETEIDTDLVYLPIMWTGFHICNDWGNNYGDIQIFCDSLPKDKKYFTIVQYDDGVKIDMPNLVTFSCCGNKSKILQDIPIPLLCDRHNVSHKSDDILASFIGRIGSKVRPRMFQELSGNPSFILKDSGDNIPLFLDHLSRSTFSLCPRGYGISSFRLYESLEIGSIPIYIVDDTEDFWLPFRNEVDWSKLAILLKESEIQNLPEILSSMSYDEILDRREYIGKIYPDFFTMEGTCNNISKILENIKTKK